MTYFTAETSSFLACHRLAEAMLPPPRLRALLEASGGDPEAALASHTGLTPRQIERLERAAKATPNPRVWEQALAWDVTALVCTSPDYPQDLRHFDDSPPILFVRGKLPATPGLAIVGSRRATGYGKGQAVRFAQVFAEAGFTVVSGGAAGIDTAAHKGTLEVGGATIAVVACGLDYIYPAENRQLFEQLVAQGGAIVSEFSVGTKPEPWRFPARNRIIAALSQVTVVIESPEQSGALITARNAAEYGRDVWVVPGPVDTGRSRGGHRLVQDGASLADSPEDILEALAVMPRAINLALPLEVEERVPEQKPLPELPPDEAALLTQLSSMASGLDDAAEAAGLAPAQALVAATMLEMKGLVQRQPGNQFRRS
ncbi:MAG: DNA-processing protein DprA [Armatimonadetes bacterium]|jgi:DNA processing protein|nr:DNA-processing protein DprA [Armatimonadota bacterium]